MRYIRRIYNKVDNKYCIVRSYCHCVSQDSLPGVLTLGSEKEILLESLVL